MQRFGGKVGVTTGAARVLGEALADLADEDEVRQIFDASRQSSAVLTFSEPS